MRYAVIAGLRSETGPERFVIAYPNEKSLRDLIAARSIIAVGFSSREGAATARKSSLRLAAANPRNHTSVAPKVSAGFQMGRPARRNWFSLAEVGWVPRQLLQRACHDSPRPFFLYECPLSINQDSARQFRLNGRLLTLILMRLGSFRKSQIAAHDPNKPRLQLRKPIARLL